MTTTTETDTEVAAKRAEWLEKLHGLYEWFVENPSMIDGMTVTASRWVHDDNRTAREQVVRFCDLTGPHAVSEVSTGSSYVQVNSKAFAPHYLSVYAEKKAVGHKVKDAQPEEWEWDALGEQS